MKKLILLALLSCSSLALSKQEETHLPPLSQDTPNSITHDMPERVTAARKRRAPQKQGEIIMIISPEARAKDLLSAFQYLKRVNGAKKFGVRLTDGAIISNISDMEVMPGGTIIIFKIHSMKGESVRIATIESVVTIVQTHA